MTVWTKVQKAQLRTIHSREQPTCMISDIVHLDLIVVESQRKRNFVDRNLSKLTKGGLRSSLFTLFSGTVGAGLLSLPKILSYYGLGLGIVCLIVFALLTYEMYYILNELIEKSGKRSYANVCAHYFGGVDELI